MKTQLIASAFALIAYTNIGTAQEVAKPRKVNPEKPALHRVPPPPPAFVAPVIVQDAKVKELPPAPPVPPVASVQEIVEVAPPPPPPLPAKVSKISIKDAPPAPAKRKNNN